MDFPDDRKYTEHDEWIRLDGDVATVGITDFAQDALGELVHVELPDIGRTLGEGEAFGEVESVKAVSELFSPVVGEVVEVNGGVDDDPGVVNSDPYGEGWLVRIRVADPSALDGLMDAAAYKAKVDAG